MDGFIGGVVVERIIEALNVPPAATLIFDIALIIILAAFFAFFARLFKQPLIPAYILTGLIIGPVLGLIKNISLISTLSEIGIAFLLFLAGMELNLNRLKEVAKPALIVGMVQIVFVFLIGFFVALSFHFARIESMFIALALSFSSTIIVVKLLCDKGEIDTLHGRISLGILLLQDIVAILLLIAVTHGLKIQSLVSLIVVFLKLAFMLLLIFLLKKSILDRAFKFAAYSSELLLLNAIGFCFIFTLISYVLGFGLIIGAFLAGISLSTSPFKIEIENRVRPLRDFFAIIFFVSLGMQLVFYQLDRFLLPFIALMGITLLIKPMIITFSVRILGYKKRTSFLSGASLAQLSEFSLIIALQGLLLSLISKEVFSLIVLTTIITMIITTYVIEYDDKLYRGLSSPLSILERLPAHRENIEYLSRKKKSIILFGCHRMGTVFLRAFKKQLGRLLVIDFNPEIIKSLIKQKISCFYGDITNKEVLDRISWNDVKLLLITIPNQDDNIFIIRQVKKINPHLMIFATADRIHNALELYNEGADYVILPQILGGEKGLDMLKKLEKKKGARLKEKLEHIKHLKEIHNYLY